MSEITVAIRYAKALIDLAVEQKALDKVKDDMVLFYKTVKANPQLSAVLANPIISHSKKTKILTEVFGSRVSEVTLKMFHLMVNKGRGEVLFETSHEFIAQYDVKHNITYATVTSATALSKANEAEMLKQIQAATGGTVKLHTEVDPSLIGGFVLKVGDRQIDTSVASTLRKIKKEFAAAATI
ncbi:ATP synthase F1 subunit delta [Mucilaginibacter pedocola]|uniref:ATP synthase subunit delta n=1 Tax=Mucilaginibacter pedocola TaxID=1792845 RepID=A0A1S9PDL5_9SPHI|nr:ATP synthase F1 subunit delta [Mucilaginibacter pedocola]OOQ59009.1 ATP synthase F1 subunit delta [Mucilaginibacter pedocola]